ncbi:MAG: NADH-quinone oxidoreductase subunit N [Armatimonadota bacterium]
MNAEAMYIVNAFLPEIALVALGLLVLTVDLLLSKANCRKALALGAAVCCLFVAGLAARQWMLADTRAVPDFVQRELVSTLRDDVTVVYGLASFGQMSLPKGISFTEVNSMFSTVTAESMSTAEARALVTGYVKLQRAIPTLQPLHIGLTHPALATWWLFGNDAFAAAFKVIFALALFLVLLLSVRYPVERYRGEFIALLLFSAVGLMVMVNSHDLVVLFLGLELASICLYVLTCWHKEDAYSAESGTKYLLLASLASAFFIYGASLLFVKFGTTHLSLLSGMITRPEPLVLIGLLMLLVGFAFKVAAAPFHLWAPDVYQGAPISTAAFLSTASKAAGFAVLLRALTSGFFGLSHEWWALISVMAALSMLVGNLIALHQNNVKRLLAYSGVAQAGYILIAVGALGRTQFESSADPGLGMTAAILYLFLYTVGNIGAFAVVGIVARESGSSEMSSFAGLRQRAPVLAFAMALLLLSLGGIPLLAGFVGKWFIFLSGIYQGQYLLVLLGAALSVVSIYYYLLIIKAMYILPAPEGAKPIRVGGTAALGLVIIVLMTVAVGVYPLPFLELAKATTASLLGH